MGDVVLLCGERRTAELAPGDRRSGSAQLLYTNRGFKFDQPGRYVLQAELDVQDAEGSIARSAPVAMIVQPAGTAKERKLQALTIDQGVGLSLALGDFGADTDAQAKVAQIADDFGTTDTGAACAMVMANALARDFRDPLKDEVIRKADEPARDRYLDIALEGRNAINTAKLATVVAGAREVDAPILADVKAKLGAKRLRRQDREQADKLFEDYAS
jgi:hypothetical protein